MTDQNLNDIANKTPCWFVKDFADGWIKFHDPKLAMREAMMTGATMFYSPSGKLPKHLERDPNSSGTAYEMRKEILSILDPANAASKKSNLILLLIEIYANDGKRYIDIIRDLIAASLIAQDKDPSKYLRV